MFKFLFINIFYKEIDKSKNIMSNQDYFPKGNIVTELKPKDFEQVNVVNLKDKKCTAVLFYAPWCGYCKQFAPTWEEIAKTATFFEIKAFNCENEQNKNHLLRIREDVPNFVKSFPTIIFYSGGRPIEKFNGDRTMKNIIDQCMRVCDSK
jgi:thiol-disulfide isomerase/thioredoxin